MAPDNAVVCPVFIKEKFLVDVRIRHNCLLRSHTMTNVNYIYDMQMLCIMNYRHISWGGGGGGGCTVL